jgi:outer membrane immunogenic protein
MRQLSAAFATIAVVACAQIASATDMPVKAPPPAPAPLPYNWGGLYLGGHVGYLWGRTRVEEERVVTEPNAAAKGVIGGVLAGYNWQAGPLVFGVEGDFG